jgi:DNA-binding transcriptional regulator GbsR (MarR family)
MLNMDATPEREAELLAADAIGDVIEHWGFRKALGRVWTVMFLQGEPVSAADIQERLQMSAGAVSMALTELQRWAVVRRVWRPGERREFYEAETNFWKMISKVVQERERYLAGSVRERLERARKLMKQGGVAGDPGRRARVERLGRLLAFAQAAEAVIGSFLASRRADFSEFGNLLELGRAAMGAAAGSAARPRKE